jgi:hypothetical protein
MGRRVSLVEPATQWTLFETVRPPCAKNLSDLPRRLRTVTTGFSATLRSS